MSQKNKIYILPIAFLIAVPKEAFGNPFDPGLFGYASNFDLYYLLPALFIEFLIVSVMLARRLNRNFIIPYALMHLATYPATLYAALLYSYYAEILPLAVEPFIYLALLYDRFTKLNMINQLPNKVKIIIVVIIANIFTFMLGVGMSSYLRYLEVINPRAVVARIAELQWSLEHYKKDTGRYPASTEGLEALVKDQGASGWHGPYFPKPFIPKDPWRTPYQYRSPGLHGEYDLSSFGPDKATGGEKSKDDIHNWR